MKKNFILAAAFAIGAATFTSCENDAPSINFSQTDTHVTDFTELINAIKNQTLTVAEKLDLINEAIKNQSLTLSQKLDALNTAVAQGFLSESQKLELIKTAIEGLGNKLAAIEEAIKDQTLSLATKMDLLTTAVNEGFITEAQKLELIKAAIEGLGDSLAAITKAIEDQTLSLADKMKLLNESVNSGFINQAEKLALIQKAIEGASDKLTAIEEAIKDQTLSWEAKMDLLNGAVNAGFINQAENLALIKTAIQGANDKLAAIEAAIKNQTLSLTEKMALLTTAVNNVTTAIQEGFATEADKLDLIEAAIKALKDNGIYRDANDNSAAYLQPDVLDAFLSNPDLSGAFAKTLTEIVPTVTPNFLEADGVTPHAHGEATRLSSNPQIVVDSWTTKEIDGKDMEVAKVISFTKSATYLVNGFGCTLSIGTCTYLDIEGEHDVQNAKWGETKIDFLFYKDGKYIMNAILTVIVGPAGN